MPLCLTNPKPQITIWLAGRPHEPVRTIKSQTYACNHELSTDACTSACTHSDALCRTLVFAGARWANLRLMVRSRLPR